MIAEKYNPKEFEDILYKEWEANGYFHGEDKSTKEPFNIVLPPPNVTGALHMGHAVTSVIQDTVVRRKRMQGFNTIWLPGTDHAGIATQMVVERELLKEKGLTRHDLGRDEFIKKVWEVKDRHHSIIINQMKKMGVSLDWERERFSLDKDFNKAVNAVFIKLYKKGLLYRGERLISWCPRCSTALSDLEVEQTPKKGKLYYIKYLLENSKEYLVVATTRPETLLGDVAVAINPNDERFKKFHGKKAIIPFANRVVPIILDEYVDIEFGTGCLKITPGHDFNDYEIAKKHNLETITVIDKDGLMNENAGIFSKLNVEKARIKIVEELEKSNLLEKIEDYSLMLSNCSRCNTVVEPLISHQWFVKMDQMAKRAIEVVQKEKIKFYPKGWWEQTYYRWLENIRDWCVSRQLWWGHRLPVWYCSGCEKYYVSVEKPKNKCSCGSFEYVQDSDVLDTWFSAALWPFVAFGWPNDKEKLKTFYPNSFMETGFDIIFFWVARMIMFGLEFMDEVPFKEVLYHALVRDEKGQKMSKTKGNVIDPLKMIDIYGTDTLRFTLTSMAGRQRDIKLSEKAMEGYSFFMNKIWQASRFVYLNSEGLNKNFNISKIEHKLNKWILYRLNETIKEVNQKLDNYDLSDASEILYKFFWNEFCDWYIEFSKPLLLNSQTKEETKYVLLYVHREFLKLLHPMAPFITEKLYLSHPLKDSKTIMLAEYPKEKNFFEIQEEVEIVKNIITNIRHVRNVYGINTKTQCFIITEKLKELVPLFKDQITKLCSLEDIKIIVDDLSCIDVSSSIHIVLPDLDIYIPLKGLIDFDKETQRLNKKLDSVKNDLIIIGKKLNNEKFMQNAEPVIIEKEKEKHIEALKLHEELTNALELLKQCQI